MGWQKKIKGKFHPEVKEDHENGHNSIFLKFCFLVPEISASEILILLTKPWLGSLW
jgi:hypothetical protein